MYESPISVTWGEIEQATKRIADAAETYIVARCQMEVDVDKDELIRALNYDRAQYEKGYRDGRADSIKRGFWLGEYSKIRLNLDEEGCVITDYECAICSECGSDLLASDEYRVRGVYCPACGALMDDKRRGEK